MKRKILVELEIDAEDKYCGDCRLLDWEHCPTPHCNIFRSNEYMEEVEDEDGMLLKLRWNECIASGKEVV